MIFQEDNCLSRASESDSGIGSSGSGSGTSKLMPGFIANPDISKYVTNVSSSVVDHRSISDNSMVNLKFSLLRLDFLTIKKFLIMYT